MEGTLMKGGKRNSVMLEVESDLYTLMHTWYSHQGVFLFQYIRELYTTSTYQSSMQVSFNESTWLLKIGHIRSNWYMWCVSVMLTRSFTFVYIVRKGKGNLLKAWGFYNDCGISVVKLSIFAFYLLNRGSSTCLWKAMCWQYLHWLENAFWHEEKKKIPKFAGRTQKYLKNWIDWIGDTPFLSFIMSFSARKSISYKQFDNYFWSTYVPYRSVSRFNFACLVNCLSVLHGKTFKLWFDDKTLRVSLHWEVSVLISFVESKIRVTTRLCSVVVLAWISLTVTDHMVPW